MAARPYAVIEGDDDKVDEEDDRKSDKQHREAFDCAVTVMMYVMWKNIFVMY